MYARFIGITLAVFLALSAIQVASAQSFLDRITEQIQQNISNNNAAPPLQPANEPTPASPRDTLPAPRELSPASPAARPSLGLRVTEVTDEAIRNHQLVVRRGALISAIEKGSVADRAGLPLGGVIVAVDGRRVDSPEDLVDAVRSARPGRDVELTYYERDRMSRKKIQLAAGQLPDVAANSNRRVSPVPQPPTPAISPSTAPAPSLGQQLGSRPLLGRIARALDNVVTAQALDAGATPVPTPAATPAPTVANRVDPNSEILLLRTQLEQLQRQVDSLQKSIESLEKKLAER